MTARLVDLGLAPVFLARLSVTGEMGYEIHAPRAYLAPLYERLMAHGREACFADIGMYALLSMRMEKGFGIWSREFSRDYRPKESGLGRYVSYDKPGFIGRDAALRDRECQLTRRLVLLDVEAHDAEANYLDPIWHAGERVGFVTSAAYGHTCGKSLAMGYLAVSAAEAGMSLEVTILGELRPCHVLERAPVDPDNVRMRA
jgi:dimethylglycine dehydrogenase